MVELGANESSEQTFTLTVVGRGSKYTYEYMGAALCIVFCIVGVGVLGALISKIGISLLPQLVVLLIVAGGLFGGVTFFMVRAIMRNIKEKKLAIADKQPDFVISADGISGSIAMLEGIQREQLLKNGDARFCRKWSEIVKVRFVPAKKGSPPLLEIICMGEGIQAAPYYITRSNFFGKEKKIVDILRAHCVEVSVEDKLW